MLLTAKKDMLFKEELENKLSPSEIRIVKELVLKELIGMMPLLMQ